MICVNILHGFFFVLFFVLGGGGGGISTIFLLCYWSTPQVSKLHLLVIAYKGRQVKTVRFTFLQEIKFVS